MTVTAKLLRLFRVDQQLRGLRSRLEAAEAFLATQERLLAELDAKHAASEAQLKKTKVAVSGDEGEALTIAARMETLREQMKTAQTNKVYSAFLTELNTLKQQKDAVEKRALEQMEGVQKQESGLSAALASRAERAAIVAKARADRDSKAAEIKDRVAELGAQRAQLATEVPKDALKSFEDLIARRGDDAMSHVEVLDRRNHEWTCGACQMALPMETVNNLSMGRLTKCSSCGCFLYTEEDVVSKKVKQPADA
jgi:predicted  nucleic acid-binding Zn-ribbon protein